MQADICRSIMLQPKTGGASSPVDLRSVLRHQDSFTVTYLRSPYFPVPLLNTA